MVERSRLRLLGGLLASVALPGCVDPYYYDGGHYPHHHHDYHFYPHAGVYFHVVTGWYYYRDGPRWVRVRRLPPRFRLDPRYRYTMRVPRGRPWRHYDQHRRRYINAPPQRVTPRVSPDRHGSPEIPDGQGHRREDRDRRRGWRNPDRPERPGRPGGPDPRGGDPRRVERPERRGRPREEEQEPERGEGREREERSDPRRGPRGGGGRRRWEEEERGGGRGRGPWR